MKWSGEQYKCRKCGEVYPYRLSTCSCGGVCDKIADAPQESSSDLNFDCSALTDILEDEKQKEQERKQKERENCENELKQLFSAVKDACRKNEYATAISFLERILGIVPDSMDAKDLLDFCTGKVEQQIRDLSIPGTNAGERRAVTVKRVEFAFRWCPAGSFMMGSKSSRAVNETQHQVTLTKGFWMMETEVSQKQWKAIMGTNPSCFKGDEFPVEKVSWNDCQEFCMKCSALGLPVQLPTEAQWEYACRAGTTETYAGNLVEMAWYTSNSKNKTHPIGTKKPNAWGLYDMHGNVLEWCQDRYGNYPSGSVTDPTGPSSGVSRVCRGGSWNYYANLCRSACRMARDPETHYYDLGVRFLRPITSPYN